MFILEIIGQGVILVAATMFVWAILVGAFRASAWLWKFTERWDKRPAWRAVALLCGFACLGSFQAFFESHPYASSEARLGVLGAWAILFFVLTLVVKIIFHPEDNSDDEDDDD